jgi:SHS2 domain-containing protein
MRAVTRSGEHVGEWRLRIYADTAEELFAEAARAIARQCGPMGGELGPEQEITVEARDLPTLLVDWLNEMLGRSEIACAAFTEVTVLELTERGLRATVRGRRVTRWRSSMKAATYHDVEMARYGSRWRASVLLDI